MNKTTTGAVAELLHSAVGQHQLGHLIEARRLYQQILLIQPDHFDAMHFIGVIAKQRGQPGEAVTLIEHAISTLNGQFTQQHASAFCNLGAAYQSASDSDSALRNYMHAIALKPDYAIAHNNLGNTLKTLGRLEDALESYENALACQPNYAEAYFNAGLVLQTLQRYDPALQCFERALQINPTYAEACFARANLWQDCSQYEQALASYDQAIALRPAYAQAYVNRGITLNRLSRYQEALHSFEAALHCQPRYANACLYRANTLKQLERYPEAIVAYRQAVELGADADQVQFALAALGVGTTPVAPPTNYVRDLFDQYADHFDQHLTQVLDYDTPQHLHALLDKYRQRNDLDTIDLGCGTGLCAALLRHHSRSLVGVDLSRKMLDQAARLNLYDLLACAEATEFLRGQPTTSDLIFAADVLVYLGDLQALFDAVTQALRSDGFFCFSVEDACSDKSDYRLTHSSRYAHSEQYLRNLAQQCDLTVIEITRHAGRSENRQRTPILITLLQKA